MASQQRVEWAKLKTGILATVAMVIAAALIFLLTGASVMLLTILTVSYQSVRAAVTNPVKSLRAE